MSDQTPTSPTPPDPAATAEPIPAPTPAPAADSPAAPPPPPAPPVPAYGAAVPQMYGPGPVGKVRSTGLCFLWTILTLGIYTFFWMGFVHSELKQHTGRGLGGAVAVILWLFISPVMFFLTPMEIGNTQELAGRQPTVSALWGLWILLPVIGPIIWFVKVNSDLNDYWKSMGAPA